MQKKIIIVCGPTGTGKTRLAFTIAKQYNGELISADSRQIYRGMDIVTAKQLPNSIIQQVEKETNTLFYTIDGVRCFLYDVVSPNQSYSVSQYQIQARKALHVIDLHKKLPIIVGGTGLYIDAIIKNGETLSIPPNAELRSSLSPYSVSELQQELSRVSPELYDQMNSSDKKNPRRLIRKIEIALFNRKRISYPNTTNIQDQYDVLWIGLTSSLEYLLSQVRPRVEYRLAHGALEELYRLLRVGYTWQMPSMQTIGYQEWREYVDNPTDILFQQAKEQWILHEQQYIKRQLTWFKKNKKIHWFDIQDRTNDEKITSYIKKWYTTSEIV